MKDRSGALWARIRERLSRSFRSRANLRNVYQAVNYSFDAGPYFEEFDPDIGEGKSPNAKVIPFYLPQFHEFEFNNANWGKGFTEWTNIARNVPRFEGHIAPRVPRDLGFYDLTVGDIQVRQMEMARKAGIHGFCYYYYRFDGAPFMQAPLERMLASEQVDFPFCVMWCNETWTRTWAGQGKSIIAEQKYSMDLLSDLVDDLARLFRDPRYIRIQGRPILTIYRATYLPDVRDYLSNMRRLFQDRHKLDPLLTMAQTDLATDPRPLEFDGAIEFVANKYSDALPRRILSRWDEKTNRNIRDFDDLVSISLSEAAPDFELARSIMPHWDNHARRPGRGHVIAGSTPAKFEAWATEIVRRSARDRFFGERMVFVNAWNEWAEGAYLEPDTHFGAAYLNALARAVFAAE